MGHLFLSVTLGDVVEHVGTAVIVKVHIDIRERDTVGIKETFEQ